MSYQYYHENNTNAIYYRSRWFNNNWSSWQRIDNYGTTSLSALASALGAPYVQTLSASGDANNCLLGVYLCNGDAAHLPTAATYYLLAYSVSANRTFQYATRAGDGAIYTRCNNNGTWSSWSRNDNYGTTSLEGLASALGVPSVYRYNSVAQGTIENFHKGYCLILVGNISNGRTALFMKGAGYIEMISGESNSFSTTKDTVGKINVYNVEEYDFSIQQNMTSSISFRVGIFTA